MKKSKYFLVIALIVTLLSAIITNCGDHSVETTNFTYDDSVIKEIETPVEVSSESIYYVYHKIMMKYTVYYRIFVNLNHPNGYIIIQKIEKYNPKFDDTKIWEIMEKTPKVYINYIHSTITAKINNNIDNLVELQGISNADKEFREVFRTAEAVILGYYYSKEVNPVHGIEVIKASKRMNGRIYGKNR